MSWNKNIKKTGYSSRNRTKLVRGGREYFSHLKSLIDKASFSLHLQFYIFSEDETGEMVIGALKAASQRGVTVFLHLDSYASQGLSKHTVRDMREAGIKVKWFEPMFRSKHFYFGRRLHHKVVVADGLYSLVGGINVSDRYNDMPGDPAWLDMALYCEGEASFALYNICRMMWGDKKRYPVISWEDVDRFCEQIPENEQVLVRVSRNDWVKRKIEIWRRYLEMFSRSEKQITIMCSYFLPGRISRKRLALASRKGVKIRLILASTSDIMITKHAERYLYNWLFKNNITIYEYQDTVLHAKMAVFDSNWVTIGSYNINNISAFASLELNMDISNSSFALETEAVLDEIISKHCRQITRENYISSNHFLKRIWQRLCYWLINNTLNLFTFYFKQEE